MTLGDNVSVAGRDAYDLVLTPKTDQTLIDHVSIAVDGTTGLPLKVAVTARGATSAAFDVEYSTFSDQKPDASLFSFTPPKGATVTEQKPPSGGHAAEAKTTHPRPTVTGTGWASIVSLPAGSAPASLVGDRLFTQLTQPVDGGRALSSSLLSVLVTSDGRVLAGAVPVSALQAAANAAGQ